jgi:cation diffusion facilitator family transporter
MSDLRTLHRRSLLRRGVILSATVVVWNVIEGIIAVGSGIVANSVALISFGIDSFIEVASAVVVWVRLQREITQNSTDAIEETERRTARITGTLLLFLACYIVIDAVRRLLGLGPEAAPSTVGMMLTCASLVAMPLLGWAKLKTAGELESRAMRADAFETIACAWLSLATLGGLSLNAAFGWSWADPLAALAIVPLVVREGIEGLKQESDYD